MKENGAESKEKLSSDISVEKGRQKNPQTHNGPAKANPGKGKRGLTKPEGSDIENPT